MQLPVKHVPSWVESSVPRKPGVWRKVIIPTLCTQRQKSRSSSSQFLSELRDDLGYTGSNQEKGNWHT